MRESHRDGLDQQIVLLSHTHEMVAITVYQVGFIPIDSCMRSMIVVHWVSLCS